MTSDLDIYRSAKLLIDQHGDTYNALYERRITFTSTMATDTFPFSDTVVESLVPVVANGWERTFKDDFDPVIFRNALARSLGYLTQGQRRERYGTRRG